jgi:hypothetical protein
MTTRNKNLTTLDNKMAMPGRLQNKMAASGQNKMAAPGQNKMASAVLLQQIQTLSDLQNSGTVHHADPAAQVLHIFLSGFWIRIRIKKFCGSGFGIRIRF